MGLGESKWQVFGLMLKDLLTQLTSVISGRHDSAYTLYDGTGRKSLKVMCIAHKSLDLYLIHRTEQHGLLARKRDRVQEGLSWSNRRGRQAGGLSASYLVENLSKHSLVHPLAHDSWCVNWRKRVALHVVNDSVAIVRHY